MLPKNRERLFFIGMATSMATLVFFGFADTFYVGPWTDTQSSTPLRPIMVIHGIVFTAWFLLLIVQPALVAGRRIDIHRKLGWLGVALAIAVVFLGAWAGLEAAARPVGGDKSPKELDFLGVILFGLVMFGVLVILAIVHRNEPQYHKRFMLLATVNLLQAAVVRLPLDIPGDLGAAKTFLFADLFILPIVVWDLIVLRRIHPATLWGGLAILVSLPARFFLSGTGVWLEIAQWGVSLVR